LKTCTTARHGVETQLPSAGINWQANAARTFSMRSGEAGDLRQSK
jgi:hypothetical protein